MNDSWNDSWNTYLAPLGRLLLCGLFIWAGYTKLFVFGPGGTAKYMDSVHIPLPGLVAWVAIIVELKRIPIILKHSLHA
jgi:uncharacterized membrane protein YphA (DoxX/SURF4 family)